MLTNFLYSVVLFFLFSPHAQIVLTKLGPRRAYQTRTQTLNTDWTTSVRIARKG